jgi:3-deoxy-D-manno-octulosonic-acid transferase
LNGRISDKSFQAWQKIKNFFRMIVKNFSRIVVQSEVDRQKFQDLGVKNAINLGNIKFANQKLEVNKAESEILTSHLKNKKVIIFASTHPEDEKIIFPIIKEIKQQFLDSYFILVPRHPERIKSIIDNCRALNLSVTAKSQNPLPILSDDLYIVDKFGEVGLFFSLSLISFIGGSFKQGGHNILEAAYFSNCIIFGPDMSKNINIANEALESNSAIQISSGQDLLVKLQYLLHPNNREELEEYRKNALKFVKKNQLILDKYLGIISKYIVN